MDPGRVLQTPSASTCSCVVPLSAPVPRSLLDSAPRASYIAATSGMLISSWYRSAEARSSRCQPNSVSRLRATGNSSEAINGKVMNLGSAATRHGHRPSRRCPTERNKASPIAGWRQQTARHETVFEQAPRESPTPPPSTRTHSSMPIRTCTRGFRSVAEPGAAGRRIRQHGDECGAADDAA